MTIEGLLPVIRRVLYSKDFMVSVISQSRIVKNRCLDLVYLKVEDKYCVTEISSGVSLNFLPKHGLYVRDYPGQKELPLDDLPALDDDNDSEDDEDEPTPRI